MNETLKEAMRDDYDGFVQWLYDNPTLSGSFKRSLHARVVRMTENAYTLGRQESRFAYLADGVGEPPDEPIKTDPDAPRGTTGVARVSRPRYAAGGLETVSVTG